MLLVSLKSPQWVNEDDLEIFRCEVQQMLSFEWIFIIENSVKLQKLVLKGKISWGISSHLGQWHQLY
jgi:hypothetical protein